MCHALRFSEHGILAVCQKTSFPHNKGGSVTYEHDAEKKDRYRNSRIRFWNTAVFYIYPYFFRFPKINANVTITEIISAVTIENHIPFRPKKIGRTSTAMT